MKKFIFILLFILTFSSVSAATISKISVDVNKSNLAIKETAYLSVFMTDSSGSTIDILPTAKATPANLVTIWSFVGCNTAEWRDVCGKYDSELIWIKWAYVAPITANKNGAATIEVFAQKQMQKISLQIGESSTTVEEVKTAVETPDNADANISATNSTKLAKPTTSMEKIQTGWDIKWKQFIIIGFIVFCVSALAFNRTKINN